MAGNVTATQNRELDSRAHTLCALFQSSAVSSSIVEVAIRTNFVLGSHFFLRH